MAAAFLAGLIGVVYLSLRGEEVTVPQVVGKNFNEGEKELEAIGLKVKNIASRYSQEPPNTILEQRPRAGDTAKTGLMISVIVSETNPEGGEEPAIIKKETANTVAEEEAGTDIAPDKNIKTNKNSNTKKPAQTTRDVIVNKSAKNTNSNGSGANSNNTKSNSADANKNAGNKNTSAIPANKTVVPPANTSQPKPTPVKPAATKTPTSGETRTRRIP